MCLNAGWRGLRNSEVRQHFNSTIYAFVPEWGDVEALMRGLGLDYRVHYMGKNQGEAVLEQV